MSPPRVVICGPVAGRGGYAEGIEHGENLRRRKRCDPGCLFCAMERAPKGYEYVGGTWRKKP